MAKFKIGDKVIVKSNKWGMKGLKGVVFKALTNPEGYIVDLPSIKDSGEFLAEDLAATNNSTTPTCPVVANALAWKAKNAVASNSSSFEIGVGDKVTVEGKTGFVKAKYFKGSKICIDVDVGSKTVTVEPKDVMKNSASVARNAGDDKMRWLAKINKMKQALEFWDDDFAMYAAHGEWSEIRDSERMARAIDDAFGRLFTELNKASRV